MAEMTLHEEINYTMDQRDAAYKEIELLSARLKEVEAERDEWKHKCEFADGWARARNTDIAAVSAERDKLREFILNHMHPRSLDMNGTSEWHVSGRLSRALTREDALNVLLADGGGE